MSSAAHSLAIEHEPALRWLPREKWALVAAVAGCLATSICTWTNGSIHTLVFIATTWAYAVPAGVVVRFIVLSAHTGAGRTRRLAAAWINRVAVLAGVFVLAEIPGCFAGTMLVSIQVDRAERWCESLVPQIEAWHERTGAYPSSLSELGIELDPPKLCRDGSLLYSASADSYDFDFFDGGFLSGYAWSSKRQVWEHYD